MSTLGTWDQINGAIGSTTSAFGGEWGNYISKLLTGEDIGLIDPTKKPNINTEFRFRSQKLRLNDTDDSHQLTFVVDDIDTGPIRKVHIRRMNNPNEEDYMVLENQTQNLANKNLINVSLDPDDGTGAGLYIWDSNYSHKYFIGSNNLTNNRTVYLPFITADGDFMVTNASQTMSNKVFSGGILIKDNNNNNITLAHASVGTPPDQTFHFFPDYTKQVGATNNPLYFGYNSEITEYSFRSLWSGTNKEYLKLDAVNNLISLKSPTRIGDNLRVKIADTALTAERTFTYPDANGEVLTDNSTKTVSGKTFEGLSVRKTANQSFETIATLSTTTANLTDYLSVENQTTAANSFNTILRAVTVSTNSLSTLESLHIGSLIKNANDVANDVPTIVMAARTENTPFVLANRPIFGIRNYNVNEYMFYHDRLDLYGNRLANATEIAQNPLTKRWGSVQPGYGTAVGTVGVLDGLAQFFTPTGAGSNTVSFDTTEGKVTNYQTSSASGVVAGLVSPTAGGGFGRRLFGGKMICRFKLDSTTSARFYFGLTSATSLPVSDTPLANTDHGIIVGFTSADTNYQIRTNDGATSVTTTAMSGTIAKTNATSFHTIEISWTASGNYIVSYDGTPQTISSDLPATTADLYPNLMVQTSAVVQRTFTLKGLWVEIDK